MRLLVMYGDSSQYVVDESVSYNTGSAIQTDWIVNNQVSQLPWAVRISRLSDLEQEPWPPLGILGFDILCIKIDDCCKLNISRFIEAYVQ